MSGPKVINIEAVRRQQRRASMANLRRLELALAACERWQAQPQSTPLLERLHAMKEAEQWAPLSLETARLVSFYEEENHRLRQLHAEEQAASFRRAHRLRQGIARMKLQLQGQPASPERNRLLGQFAAGDVSAQETALNDALRFIEQQQRGEYTNRLRELTAVLMDSSADSATSGLPLAPADPLEQRLEKCWQLLGELSALEDSAELRGFKEKAQRITIAPIDQQALLLDSLALELSSHMKSRRTTLALHNELKLLLVDLESVSSPEAAAWKGRLDAALVQPLLSDPTRKLIEEARAWIERTISDETRHEQRAAVLRALAGIGYEVRDGMATAWVEQGRIILRKPNESAYGIELSASVQGSAVQTRVVALSDSPRDPQRDLEVEESWCGEFARARGFLNEAGFNASLVHWHPAGSVPLKTVVTQSSHQNDLRILKSHKAPRNNPEK